ncbi:ComEC/Rec2 family competence protein [Caulobacter sp. KR2-114]|uniref:ComEC/Rec2 family competence protein n=1 Tax=Caulobacter sp. KR2-114 TaxID=3400912 RepID=UPI003C024068
MLGAPIAFGGGAAVYFALPDEPPLGPLLALAGAATLLALAARRWSRSRALIILVLYAALFAGGLAAGRIRTLRVAAPIAPFSQSTLVEGWVTDVPSAASGRARLMIAPVRIGRLRRDQLPNRLRVTVPGDLMIGPGRAVRLAAFISPPPAPASPGAYDFARDEYFQGIGAVGFSKASPELISLPPPPLALRIELAINQARWALSRRIAGDMDAKSAGLGVAMITGYQAWLSDDDQTSLRNSGLAHIISISGVHMAIVGGFVFLAVRLLVALWPWLALRVPGKKVAAAVGLAAILLYLLVSGAPPPAQRSAITASLVFGAILVDRRAISLHVLAIAALTILLLQPEAIVQPGFQMSFAATTALVALAEVWPRRPHPISVPWPIRVVQQGFGWLAISLAASFVAGLATEPFGVQDFNRTAVYGLGANLVTEPLETFVIMPALALGALAETFHLGAPLLALAGWGIDLLYRVSGWFSGLPWSVWTVPSKPDFTLPVAFLGILMLCLWKGRLRWIGLPCALMVSLWPRPPAPEVWVASDAAAAAVQDGHTAWLLRPKVRLFAADMWSRRQAFMLEDDDPARTRPFDCDRRICGAVTASGGRVVLWWIHRTPAGAELDDLCRNADLILIRATKVAATPACAGKPMLTGEDFARGGSAELYRASRGWNVVWAQDVRGRRPWSQASDSGE